MDGYSRLRSDQKKMRCDANRSESKRKCSHDSHVSYHPSSSWYVGIDELEGAPCWFYLRALFSRVERRASNQYGGFDNDLHRLGLWR